MLKRFTRALSAVACLWATPQIADADITLLSELELTLPDTVGGLSGIELDAGGQHAVLLSDRGTLYRAKITRAPQGQAIGLAITDTLRLRHHGEHKHPDSEGLALLDRSQIAVSAEDPTRLLLYRWGNKDPSYVPDLPTTRELDDNRGLEALAVSPNGTLYTLFETPDGASYPLYLYRDGGWQHGPNLPAHEDFSIVGADFDEAGRLYVLERAFSALGFRTQIRRVTFTQDKTREEVLLRTPLGRFDNLEGLAVSTDTEGRTRLSLISDDNFLSILRMSLVEFTITE